MEEEQEEGVLCRAKCCCGKTLKVTPCILGQMCFGFWILGGVAALFVFLIIKWA